MKRARLALVLLVLMSGRVGAQTPTQSARFDFGDTALAIRVGTTASINLITGNNCNGVADYDITLFFDASRVTLAGATTVPGTNLPAPSIVTGTDSARIVATGTGFTTCGFQPFVTLTFAMNAGATTGSLVSTRINRLKATFSSVVTDVTANAVSSLLNVCEGAHIWGDLDDNGFVTSRDALAALTAAVGLPTPGFDLSYGDVDADGSITARDALFVLSRGIGLTGARAGQVAIIHCAPLAPAPTDMLYWTNHGLTRINAGDTIPTELGVFGNNSNPARFSPDGGKIAYVCNTGNNHICTVDRDGGNLHDLLVGLGADENHPVWSPDGLRIAFFDLNGVTRTIRDVDSSGSTPHLVITGSTPLLELGGWSSNGLVYTPLVSGQRKLFKVNADGSGGIEVFSGSSSTFPSEPSWSPNADSVAFHNGSFASGSIFVVPLGGAVGSAKRRTQLIGLGSAPAWISAGIAFSSGAFFPSEIVLQAPSGRYFRLTRTPISGGASYPTFRGPPAP